MQSARKNSIREAVIETASRLFYKQGYANTGINQIIEESGVVKSSLYQGFRSKEDVLMAYLETAGAATDQALLDAVNRYDEPVQSVLAVFDYVMDLVQGEGYNGCNFLNIISEIPPDGDRIKKQIQQQKDGVRNLFRKTLTPINKEHLADELYLLFEGALIANKVHGQVWPVESARKIATQLLK